MVTAPAHLLGIGIATIAALASASQLLLVRKGTDAGRAYDAVLIVMLVNVVALVPLVGVYYYPEYHLTRVSWVAFIAAGLFGTLLGRACQYASVDRIGASRTAPIVASNAIIATVLGVLVLGETVTGVHGVGVVLVVGGVAAISWETTHENPDDLNTRELLLGMLLPFGAALAYGMEPIFANLGFAEGTPAPVGLVLKTIAATIGFLLYLAWRSSLPPLGSLRTGNSWWFVLAGIANTTFLLAYYVSLAIAPVSIVMPIIITNTLFVVVLSALFMPQHLERVTWRLAAAAGIVVVGVGLITVFG